jgi:hypothetical protein
VPAPLKILFAVLLVGAAVMLVVVQRDAVTGSDEASFSKPEYVDALIPASGTEVLSQDTVGIDLKDGYDAYLVINGKTIQNEATDKDPDGLVKVPTVGTITYDPAPGKRIEKLDTPRQCIDAWVWKKLDGPATKKQVNWCFKVS